LECAKIFSNDKVEFPIVTSQSKKGMQSTRSQILEILKKRGRSSVEELAATLSLSPMTVRQHLSVLERERYVTTNVQRRRLGRPHYVYSLTPQGEDLFPKQYLILAERLMIELQALDAKEIAGLEAEAKLRLIFEKMADRLASLHQGRLAGRTLEDKVRLVAEILNEEGNLAEWRDEGHEYAIIDYNCPYLRVAERHVHVCAFHLRFLSRLFETKVVRRHCMVEGDTFCCYHIGKEGSTATAKLSATARED